MESTEPITEVQRLSIAERDFIMRWFVEKKIDKSQLFAARLWQHDAEQVTVQSGGVDLSAPISDQQVWQIDGDLTDSQWRALRRRGVVCNAYGLTVVRFLDDCLAPDMCRDSLDRSKRHGHYWQDQLKFYLRQIAVCYGQIPASNLQKTESEAHNALSKLRELESVDAT
jgi:hypothetical protein